MTEEQQPEIQATDDLPSNSDITIGDGIRDMISTTLSLGASMAKMVAEATAGGHKVAPPQNQDPINGIVHYSVISVVNVVSTVASNANQVRTAAASAPAQTTKTSAPSPEPTDAQQHNLPTVHRGATLRIPLSIENPGTEPMIEMSFVCLEMRLIKREGDEGSYSLDWVRFEPPMLSIAPNDFEKLTVFIDIPEDATVGRYQTSIGLHTNVPVAVIDFSVIEQSE